MRAGGKNRNKSTNCGKKRGRAPTPGRLSADYASFTAFAAKYAFPGRQIIRFQAWLQRWNDANHIASLVPHP